ncbi:TPA: hypothetical protein ACNH0M_001034 [Morganella morganii]
MTFTRTSNGLRNYHSFYNSDIVVYIEGRLKSKDETENIDTDKIPDAIFYNSLFKALSPHEKIKVKIVGCKKNVLDYHDKIVSEDIDNSYAVIDRDYDGILFSRIATDKLIVTHGYSWENDFWSSKLCSEVIKDISLDEKVANEIVDIKYNRSIKRLCIINRANIVSQYFCGSIFPISKKGGSNGFKYDVNSKFPLSAQEVRRILASLPTEIKYDVNIKKLINATKISFSNLIQGHFYEFMTIQILLYAYKISSEINHNIADFSMIKSMALNKFKLKPNYFLEAKTLEHYEEQFNRLFN